MERFNFKKKFGQNFITDKNLIYKITSLVPITNNDLVIEVGPGEGALTINLVNMAKHVLIYEIDKDLEDILNNKLIDFNNYTLTIKDFLEVDIKKEIKNYNYNKLIFVSNLPYYITTPIIKKFIDSGVLCDYMVVMVQEEVANRFCANVGSKDYGSLSVFLQSFYNVRKVLNVSRMLFNPIPNVDSAVVVMEKKDIVSVKDYDFYKKFVKDCFRFKRKTLKNNLNGYDLEIIDDILSKYNLNLGCRAEDISVDIFIELVNLIEKR